jgi:phage terminase large subunit GpA-like protein
MEFINLKLGEPWEDQNIGEEDWENLLRRREYYNTDIDSIPEGVFILTAGADIQHNRIECTVYGWGMGKECWAIEHRIFFGDPSDVDNPVWKDFDNFLNKKYKIRAGVKLSIACACVDSGDGALSNTIYKFTKPREVRRVFSSKGRGGVGVPFINRPTKTTREGAMLFSIGVDGGKTTLFRRLKEEFEGPNYVHFPREEERGFDEEFFKQLYGERLMVKFEKGQKKIYWEKIRERNEALDCAVYATAALEIINPNFEMLKKIFTNSGHVVAEKSKKRGTLFTAI